MPAFPASLLTPNLIMHGDLLLITPVALTAASGTPNTTPQGGTFSFSPEPSGADATIVLTAQGVGAVPTTVTANVLVSDDNGATWKTFATAAPLVAGGISAAAEILHAVAGRLYAISLSTLTLGSATAVNIYAAVS